MRNALVRVLFAGISTATLGACGEPTGNPAPMQVLEQTESDLCSAGTGSQYCNLGLWPNGILYYQFLNTDPAYQAGVRAGMNRWEDATYGTVRFIEDSTQPIRAFISSGSSAVGYDACSSSPSNCYIATTSGIPDHELGHALGLPHSHQRYDRNHYVQVNFNQCASFPQDWAQCNSPEATGDLGPFNFQSTMGYRPTHPDIARWNGSRICANYDANDICVPIPDTAGPQGYVTKLDGAAVTELYRTAQGWAKFKRTDNEDQSPSGLTTPYPDVLTGSVRMIGSPALATTATANALRLFTRGTDNQIYEKTLSSTSFPRTWSAWTAHPNGTFASDPAAVFAGSYTHLAARGMDGNIWIQSWTGSTPPGGYASLGAPTVGAASAPSITSWGNGRVDVFVRGTDDKLYWRRCSTSGTNCSPSSGNWNSWSLVSSSGTFIGKPAAISGRVSGVIDVFVHGFDHRLWGIQYANGIWASFYQVAANGTLGLNDSDPASQSCVGADCYSPSVTANPNGIDVIIRGNDAKAWIASYTAGGTWSGYTPLGGVLASSPAMPSRARSSRIIDLIATMDEERALGTFVPTMWWKHFPTP